MSYWVRYVPVSLILLLLLWMHFRMAGWLASAACVRGSRARRAAVWAVFGVLSGLVCLGAVLGRGRVVQFLEHASWVPWFRALALTWALVSIGVFLALLVWRRLPEFDPARRRLFRASAGAFLAAPFAATAFGVFVQRGDLRVREIELPLPGLPRDLEGLRLVQLTDIHLGPFLSERELARAVDMANEWKGHLALVTGDLITAAGDALDACLNQLSRLRADAGILGCLGNHEVYAGAEDYTAMQGSRLGIEFLRGSSRLLRFGSASVNVAGVDYQPAGRPYLDGARGLLANGAQNILLSHNPDVFPAAAGQGWGLTIAGHTHGGQLNFEIFDQSFNLARFYTPYVYGVYRQARSAIYVSRGIGTVGIPARIGAPPEVACIRLVRAEG